MGYADYFYLGSRGMFAEKIISRQEGDTTPDDLLKLRGLRQYAASIGMSWRKFCASSMMFDDNLNVIETLTNNGLACQNALEINKALGA